MAEVSEKSTTGFSWQRAFERQATTVVARARLPADSGRELKLVIRDDLNEFVKCEETEDSRGNDLKRNDSWPNAVQRHTHKLCSTRGVMLTKDATHSGGEDLVNSIVDLCLKVYKQE